MKSKGDWTQKQHDLFLFSLCAQVARADAAIPDHPSREAHSGSGDTKQTGN